MKKLLLAVLVLVLLASSALAQTQPASPTVVFYGNPTTGYEWTHAVENEAILKVEGDYVIMGGDEGSTGLGGMYEFALVGLAEGYTAATFTYARSWETDVAPVCTVIYSVYVAPDLSVTINACETDPNPDLPEEE